MKINAHPVYQDAPLQPGTHKGKIFNRSFLYYLSVQPLCNYEITSRFQTYSLKVEFPSAGVAWEHLDHLNLGTAQHSIGDCKLVKLADALCCAEGKENEVPTWNNTECKLILTKACPNSEVQINPWKCQWIWVQHRRKLSKPHTMPCTCQVGMRCILNTFIVRQWKLIVFHFWLKARFLSPEITKLEPLANSGHF